MPAAAAPLSLTPSPAAPSRQPALDAVSAKLSSSAAAASDGVDLTSSLNRARDKFRVTFKEKHMAMMKPWVDAADNIQIKISAEGKALVLCPCCKKSITCGYSQATGTLS